jgi:ubiquinone/menaquinone biosynthesis C-methylase UbiE
MLERVLEPEVMDTEEDAREYAAIDNASVNEEFAARAVELAPGRGALLDVGTGPGHIAVLIAQKAPGLRVVAIDLADSMLVLARETVRQAGLEGRVRVCRADAKCTDYANEEFDMVVSNSVVHHIPHPGTFFAEIGRLGRPGGGLFVKDLHRPASEEEHRALVERYASDCTPHQRKLFADSLRAALTCEEVEAMCREAGLTGVSIGRTSDRHWCLERSCRPAH